MEALATRQFRRYVGAWRRPDLQTARGEMSDTVIEAKLAEQRSAGSAEKASPRGGSSAWIARVDGYDVATIVLVAALAIIALLHLQGLRDLQR